MKIHAGEKDGFSIVSLYPGADPVEQEEAVSSLAEYITVVRRIYERSKKLTGMDQPAKI